MHYLKIVAFTLILMAMGYYNFYHVINVEKIVVDQIILLVFIFTVKLNPERGITYISLIVPTICAIFAALTASFAKDIEIYKMFYTISLLFYFIGGYHWFITDLEIESNKIKNTEPVLV